MTPGKRWYPVYGMLLLALLAIPAAGQSNQVFITDTTYFPGNETFTVNDVDITTGTPTFFDGGPMRVQLLDRSGALLFIGSFRVYPPGVEDLLEPGESLAPAHTQYRLPYHENATTLRFLKNETVLTTIDLTGTACENDGFCRAYCRGKAADPDCPDYTPPDQDSDIAVITLGLLAGVLLGAALLYRRRIT